MIPKLAEGLVNDTDGDHLTTNLAAEVGVDADLDILIFLSSLVHAALSEEGEDCSLAHEIYELAVQNTDIWQNSWFMIRLQRLSSFGEVPGRREAFNFQSEDVSESTK